MRIATFNAAGLRPRIPMLIDWLAENEPDVLALQETKVEDDKFPREPFEDLGYDLALHGIKSWNGVAIASRLPMLGVRAGFCDDLFPQDGRVISAQIEGVHVVNTYVPNGTALGTEKFEYKLRWLERFRTYLDQCFRPDEPVVWLGDVNIAPTPADVYNSARFYGRVGHHPDEFSRLQRIVDFGLTDLFRKHCPEPKHYTYWEFTIPQSVTRNLGWRIDHIYGTPSVAERCSACWIDKAARESEKPSDHTFVVADLF